MLGPYKTRMNEFHVRFPGRTEEGLRRSRCVIERSEAQSCASGGACYGFTFSDYLRVHIRPFGDAIAREQTKPAYINDPFCLALLRSPPSSLTATADRLTAVTMGALTDDVLSLVTRAAAEQVRSLSIPTRGGRVGGC